MGRVNPMAAVYILTNINNGKIYIGETSNFADRMSAYRTYAKGRGGVSAAQTTIGKALLKHGADAFAYGILVSENDDPRIKDSKFRKQVEARYIYRYKSTNPDIGYNRQDENKNYGKRQNKKSVKTTTKTKILKCEPIIVYDYKKKSVMMYLGSQSCAEILGFTDRSIIIRAIKKGAMSHNYIFYKLDYDKRKENAKRILTAKSTKSDTRGMSSLKVDSYERYLEGLIATNEFCEEFGYKPVNIEKLLSKAE